ncbi:hypothetical protein [Croceicoccus bisphenolivorans]|uniref:hypothetical protein n=1 Tax=Croceicoccus bisphenolivorans TaxID=1783232 RepID=UPI000832B7EB|nr:hypothetical protein [Croceicoccus bisphenolivorans]
MSEKSFDPVAEWQSFVQRWEQEINAWSGQLTGSEEFSALMGQATKMTVLGQKAMAEQTEAILKTLNLPTKSQLEELGTRLDAIEDQIVQIRLLIEGGKATPVKPARAEPTRTRQPPAKAR